MAKQILKIGDIRKLPNNNIVIVGAYIGDNDNVINFPELIGRNIIIKGKKAEIVSKVIDITVFSSLIDKKNIGIAISEQYADKVKEGDIVFLE